LFSGNYEAWGASGKKYKARIAKFRILLAINRFSRISWKAESHLGKSESRWRKRKAVEESRKPILVNRILYEENLDVGEGFCDISQRFSSLEIPFPECNW
jgi:hypothetical protein